MSRSPGKLIVLEGPDGVGKSTLTEALAAALRRLGTLCDVYHFPGKERGTLGRHVYDFHHDPSAFGVRGVTAEALQMLHVAAHLEAISTQIRPAIDSGRWVVLDRFWWSTWVYGQRSGVPLELLKTIVAPERFMWGSVKPTIVFLVERALAHPSPEDPGVELTSIYRDLVRCEKREQRVFTINNSSTVESAVQCMLRELRSDVQVR